MWFYVKDANRHNESSKEWVRVILGVGSAAPSPALGRHEQGFWGAGDILGAHDILGFMGVFVLL